jgi:DNA repair photolyase
MSDVRARLQGPPAPALTGGSGTSIRGRGAATNPRNRFEVLHYEAELESADWDWDSCWDANRDSSAESGGPMGPATPKPSTLYLRDTSRSVLTRNDSPDVPFDVGLNPYRGCEHGCIYCYARPSHEFLGFSAGLDFESRILVKEAAPELLRAELSSPRWKPQMVGMSGVTDAYQPIERRLELTRRCLRVLAEFRNPVGVVTKNRMVARDADLLGELADYSAVTVKISLTTLDPELQRQMEPRASPPHQRLEAVRRLADAGVPVGVMVAPVVPGLTDHEIPALLEAAAEAGAGFASYIALRLPHGVKDLFADWLVRYYPARAKKVLGRLRSMRGGQLSDSRFGTRMRGEGEWAMQIQQLFELARRRAGLEAAAPAVSTAAFRRPSDRQLDLF